MTESKKNNEKFVRVQTTLSKKDNDAVLNLASKSHLNKSAMFRVLILEALELRKGKK